MKKSIALILVILILLLSGCSFSATAEFNQSSTSTITPVPVLPPIRTPQVRDPLPAEGIVKFRIIHWNDFHGELGERTYDGLWLPGAARLATEVKNAESLYGPGRTLIFDGGDFFQGSPNSQKSGGLKVLELYKRLGVDAITVGNHEFFMGVSKFNQIVSQAAPIEILSANLHKWGPNKTCSNNPILNAYKIFELGDESGPKVRVAVIGVGRYALELEAYSTIVGICYSRPADEILKFYDQMVNDEKPDLIVVISHSGLTDDKALAQALNEAGKPVDIIIGGHGHTLMTSPELIGTTYIVQAGDYGRAVGVFDIAFNREIKKAKIRWNIHLINNCTPQDTDTLSFLADSITVPTQQPVACNPTPTPDPSKTYLAALEPETVNVGYWSLGIGYYPASDTGMNEGEVISNHGQVFAQGLFTHAPSELTYTLNGNYLHFDSIISIKETACGDGAQFVVRLDGNEIFRSDWMTAASPLFPVSLNVTGGKVLTLITLSGNDNTCDWTIWGDPVLSK